MHKVIMGNEKKKTFGIFSPAVTEAAATLVCCACESESSVAAVYCSTRRMSYKKLPIYQEKKN